MENGGSLELDLMRKTGSRDHGMMRWNGMGWDGIRIDFANCNCNCNLRALPSSFQLKYNAVLQRDRRRTSEQTNDANGGGATLLLLFFFSFHRLDLFTARHKLNVKFLYICGQVECLVFYVKQKTRHARNIRRPSPWPAPLPQPATTEGHDRRTEHGKRTRQDCKPASKQASKRQPCSSQGALCLRLRGRMAAEC